ncbi:hypothetical protein LINPERHAP2_LOCUS29903 [Linum perenne]
MSRSTQARFAADDFIYEDGEVLCHCRLRASRRISRIEMNPNRKFFGCPRYSSKVDRECGFFVWFDVKIASMKEKQDLVRTIDLLHNWIHMLETENFRLRECIRGGIGDVAYSDIPFADELEMLSRRVSQLKTNGMTVHCNQKG